MKIFCFQAEIGIRFKLVTGVQTCSLPIWSARRAARRPLPAPAVVDVLRGVPTYGVDIDAELVTQIGRAPCRERVKIAGGGVSLINDKMKNPKIQSFIRV